MRTWIVSAAVMLAAALLLSWTAVPKLLTPDSSLRPPHSVGTNDRLASDTYDANGHQKSAKPKALPPGDRDFEAVRTHGARNGIPRRSGNCYTLAATGITAGDVYDAWNRLVRRVKTDGTVIDLGYDHVGNRVTKTVSTATNATFTAYLVDANSLTGYAQVLEELRDNGAGGLAVFRTYAAGNDLISQTQLLPDGNGSEAWVTHYFLYDGQGSVWGLADESGAVTDAYTYDAFGLHLREEGAGTPNVILYTGEQWDADLGQYYLRARWYEPTRGRFWTQDSFEGFNADPVTLHKYLYAGANPVSNVDPTGKMFSLAELSQATAISALVGSVSYSSYTYYMTGDARKARVAAFDGLIIGGSWGAGMYCWVSGHAVYAVIIGLSGTEVYLEVRRAWEALTQEVFSGKMPKNHFIFLPMGTWAGWIVDSDETGYYTIYFTVTENTPPYVPVEKTPTSY